MNQALFTSNTDEWSTPQYVFDYYNDIYNFTLDACASEHNHKVDNFRSKENCGLKDKWVGNIWCNPPYSHLKLWIEKSYNEAMSSNITVVMLIPARTDTIAWHKYVSKGKVTFIKGRLKFSNSENSAPFPSAIIVFNKHILLNTEGSTQYLDLKQFNKGN